jgi:type IV pilus assembly protein PilO
MEQMLKDLTIGKAAVISLVLSAIYYFALFDDGSSIQAQIDATTVGINESRTELAKIEKAIVDAAQFEKTSAELGEQMDKVRRAIPEGLTNFDMMKIISQEAKSVGANITSISGSSGGTPGKQKDGTFYEPIGVSVSISGTYNQMMTFLSNLTKLDKIVVVTTLDFTATVGGKVGLLTPTMNLNANLVGYRFVAAANTNPAAAVSGQGGE